MTSRPSSTRTSSRSTSSSLSFQFSLPEKKTSKAAEALALFQVQRKEQPPVNTAQFVQAVKGAVIGLGAGSGLVEKLNLKDRQVDYEIDFLLTRTAAGGVDIKIGSVGVTGTSSWSRKTGDQIVVTFTLKK